MEQNNYKTLDLRNLGEVDVAPLIKLLPFFVAEWNKEVDFEMNHNKKHSLKQVEHVNFRWSDKKSDPVVYYDLPLWDKYKAILLPILIDIVKPFGYRSGYFPRVMLAKMQPSTVIPSHIDGKTRGWIPHKIHVPLLTNDKTYFSIKEKQYNLKKGMAYEVNNGAMHGVKNEGNSIRIHLIFEYLNAEINAIDTPDFVIP